MMASRPQDLATIQQWMQAVIQHPGGVAAGLQDDLAQAVLPLDPAELGSVIPRSTLQTSVERLEVYAHAYFARLLEVMVSEFPALQHALGAELFLEFVTEYLQQHPSSSYTLGQLGARFPEYLIATRPPRADDTPDWADFLIDCARLERIYAEVFDGPGPEGASHRARNLPKDVETFVREPLPLAPWVRLLLLQFPVQEYVTAVRRSESPEMPPAETTHLVVSRRDYVVRRSVVTPPEFHILTSLQSGATVGEALSSLMESPWSGSIDETQVQGWFTQWTAAGYLQ